MMNIKFTSIILSLILAASFCSGCSNQKTPLGENSDPLTENSSVEEIPEVDHSIEDTNSPDVPSKAPVSSDSNNKENNKTESSSATKEEPSKSETSKGETSKEEPSKEETLKQEQIQGGGSSAVETPTLDVSPSDTPKDETTTVPEKEEDQTEVPAPKEVDYQAYQDMTSAERIAFYKSFADADKFFDWYNDAKEQYKKENPDKVIGDDPIDLGGLLG